MKKISDVWTLVYKDEDSEPQAFTYTSEEDAEAAKLMVQDSDGGELIDNHGNVDGYIKVEWCYLINGRLIDSNNEEDIKELRMENELLKADNELLKAIRDTQAYLIRKTHNRKGEGNA